MNRIKSKYSISIITAVIFLLAACNPRNDNHIILEEYQKFDTRSNKAANPDSLILKKGFTTHFLYDNSNNLFKVYSILLGLQYGHYFRFERGNVTLYYFLIDSHYKIEIKKVKSSNKYLELGTPYIDFIENVSETANKKYSLLFSEFPRKNLSVYFSINGLNYSRINLYESKIMPLLKESDIYVGTTTNKIFLKIEASELCLKLKGLPDSRVSYDTVKF